MYNLQHNKVRNEQQRNDSSNNNNFDVVSPVTHDDTEETDLRGLLMAQSAYSS